MAGNDFYDNSPLSPTVSPRIVSYYQAKEFMQEMEKQPTHPTRQWIVKDIKTGARIFFNHSIDTKK